ncbi:hypothetical protein NEOKW01_1257 [Nematocida sp. AWRm80]|nr:hypothetical protein NEOKW01_1257 [Nematocida sp. AWRm80]
MYTEDTSTASLKRVIVIMCILIITALCCIAGIFIYTMVSNSKSEGSSGSGTPTTKNTSISTNDRNKPEHTSGNPKNTPYIDDNYTYEPTRYYWSSSTDRKNRLSKEANRKNTPQTKKQMKNTKNMKNIPSHRPTMIYNKNNGGRTGVIGLR